MYADAVVMVKIATGGDFEEKAEFLKNAVLAKNHGQCWKQQMHKGADDLNFNERARTEIGA